jgi:PncC family amidohydrolase
MTGTIGLIGTMDEAHAAAAGIAAALKERGQTLAVAETAAGGLISATLLAVPGASAWFLGGAVAYSAVAKERWLSLRAGAFGPGSVVSEGGVLAMARAVREATGATWGLAEAGIAGPQTGRRSSKPAGLVYVAVSGPVEAVEEIRTGLDDRAANQHAFAAAALRLLAKVCSVAAARL